MNDNDRRVSIVALLCGMVVMLGFATCDAVTSAHRYGAKQSCVEAP